MLISDAALKVHTDPETGKEFIQLLRRCVLELLSPCLNQKLDQDLV